MDSPGTFDVRLTRGVIRQLRDRLRSDPRVQLRASSSSDWVEVEVPSTSDEALLTELVALAARAHLPPDGSSPKPPPVGRDLERRRRFH